METLTPDTDKDASGDGQEPPESGAVQSPATDEAPAPERTCEMCGGAMTAAQDWCLECGTARPGRLGRRPGWRVAASVAGATLLLLCGAVAASYAALTDDTGKQAAKPSAGSATPVAQVPPVVAAPSGAAGPSGATGATGQAGTGSTTTSTPQPSTSTPKLPSLPSLPSGTPSTKTPSVPSSGSTSTPSSTPSTTTTTKSTSTSTTTTPTNTSTTPATPTTFTALGLDGSAASVYDPYSRATAKGDPAAAITSTSGDGFSVTTPSDGKPMQVGLVVNLGARKNVTKISLATATPGFRLEVYGTDGSATPADILDTRWTHLASRSKVDASSVGANKKGDGQEEILIPPADGEQMRQVVLWITDPPSATAATVKLGNVKVYTS